MVLNEADALKPPGAEAIPYPATIPEMLRHSFAKHNLTEAVVSGERRLSYGDIDRESADLAAGLVALGIGKGTRVGILMPNDPEWAVTFSAVARTGAVTIGISTFLKAPELLYILKHADVDTLIIANQMRGHDYLERLEEIFPSLRDSDGSKSLWLDEAPYLRRILTSGPASRRWLRGTLGEIKRQKNDGELKCDSRFLDSIQKNISPADLAVIIYTSGSTAAPKAVVHTHDAIVRHTIAVSKVVHVSKGDRICAAMPFFWVGGLLVTMLAPFVNGATLICPQSQDPEELVSLLAKEKITHLSGWGNVLAAVADRSTGGTNILAGLRPMTDAQRLFFQREPIEGIPNQLGMTETFGHHSSEPANSTLPPGRAGAFGRNLPGIQRRIIDPETGREVPAGVVGELCVRGYSLMAGFYKVERWRTFDEDGWYHTGDKCSIDDDGYLFFYGRYGDMIKTSGANVSPPEVEEVIRGFPEIVDVAVFGVPDGRVGEVVCAAVVVKAQAKLTEEELISRMKNILSSFKVPKRIQFMEFDAIPRTESGKVRKHLLRKMFQE